MTYNLFLDDERFPVDDGRSWTIVRSSKEAIDYVSAHGLPQCIYFDHDLAGSDIAMTFAHWLTNYCMDNNLHLRNLEYFVHSRNPIGGKNIDLLIKNFQENWSTI